jgi:hypothetical protein
MSTNNIFLYWTGHDNVLINLLRKIIYLHSNNGKEYKVHLITHENINDYITELPNIFYQMIPSFQADFVRVSVICDYGGIWLDSDTLVLDNLKDLFNIIQNNDGFFIRENNRSVCNGVFGSKLKTPLMIKWKQKLIDLLNKPNIINDLNGNVKRLRNVTGSTVLKDIYKLDPQLYNNYTIFNGLDNMYPVNWNYCVDEYLNKPYDNYKNIEKKFQPLIILVNSVYLNLINKTEEEILNADNALNYFLKKSLNKINK